MQHDHTAHDKAQARLTADWLPGITHEDVVAALFGGDCPTEGIETYTIQPLAQTVRIYGTTEGVDTVWSFLAERKIVAPWPNFLDQEGVA
jgi:hypothetical protein